MRLINKLFLLCFISTSCYSQQLLQAQDFLLQHSNMQPAFTIKNGIGVGFPSFSTSYYNSAFSLNDLFRDNEYNKNIDDIVNNLSNDNMFVLRQCFSPILIVGQHNRHNFSFGLNQKLDIALNYPKNIIQLLWQGNEPFIGEEVEVDNIYFDYTSKFEYFIGYSHSFFDKRLTIGLKSKLIKGLQNASVEYANSTFNTKDEVQNYFELTANTNYLLNTSNVIPITESISNILGTLKYYSLSQNYGYGFDIGFKANIADKFKFNFSVCDLGKISWNANVINYQSDASFVYNGFTYDVNADDQENFFDSLLDSLKNEFNPEELSNVYSTQLTPTYNGSLLYALTKGSIGVSYNRVNYTNPFTSYAIFYTHNFSEQLALTIQYSYVERLYDNLGFSLVYNKEPIQFYVMSSNLYSLINYNQLQFSSGIVGINLIFNN